MEGVKYYTGIAQGSDEWFELRNEVPTASCFKQIITPGGKLSASRTGYMAQLLSESFFPDSGRDEINSPAIDHGNLWEPVARSEFARVTGLEVEEVTFVTSMGGRAGCSPDGIIRDFDGIASSGLEIKCPGAKVHIATVDSGEMPKDHLPQVHGSMAVTGLDSWHFWSYYPGLKPFHQIIERNDYTAKVEAALETFAVEYAAFRERMIPELEVEPVPLTEEEQLLI